MSEALGVDEEEPSWLHLVLLISAPSSNSAELTPSSVDDGAMLFFEQIEPFLEGDCEVSFVNPPIATTERRNTATQETMLVATRVRGNSQCLPCRD